MFSGSVFFLPGQEIREFSVYHPETRETEIGRVLKNNETLVGTIHAILAAARPEEKERWKQLQHPITHKIIMQFTPAFDIRPGDVFVYDGRRFYNQAMPYNVGNIGHWMIFYCEERTDIN
jgi:hypothetical protein